MAPCTSSVLLLHPTTTPALLWIPVPPSILPLPSASLPPSLVTSLPCLQLCFLGNTGKASAVCFCPFSSTLAPMHLAVSAPWEHPLHRCLSPTLQCARSPAAAGALPVPLPHQCLQPLHLLHPSRALIAARTGGAPPLRCDRTQAAQPSCQQGTGGGLSLPSPVHLPWAELALEVAQSSPITSGACLCSLGRRINYQGCGAVDHSSYYFLLLQIGVVESSVPFNPRSSVYFPAGSTNAAFPITSQRASDRSLRKTCCNCLFFSIFKHF